MASPLHNRNENKKIEDAWKNLKREFDEKEIENMRERFMEEAERRTPETGPNEEPVPIVRYIAGIAYAGLNAGYPKEKVWVARTCLEWETMDEKKERRRSIN